MKTKSLYTIYFILVGLILLSIGNNLIQFVRGVEEGVNEASKNVIGEFYLHDVRSSDKTFSYYKIDSTSLEAANDIIVVSPNTLRIKVYSKYNCTKDIIWCFVGITITSFGVMFICIFILFYLYKLFMRLRIALKKEQIFYLPLIKVMQWLGIFLIAENILEFLFYYFNYLGATKVLAIENINLSGAPTLNLMMGIFGLSLIFISQVFRIGYHIQEEQKLTI